MTEGTFNEMKLIMKSHANVNPPLTFNKTDNGYAESDSTSVQDDDSATTIQDFDRTNTEGSQRGKKKRKTSNGSNELLDALKKKWVEDREAEAIIRAENKAAQDRHLELMKRNTDATCSIAESFKIIAESRN